MQLTDICVSLSLAKELKSAGYPQKNSYYSWGNFTGAWRITSVPVDRVDEYAAPTASELTDVLPDFEKFHLTIQYVNNKYRVGYMNSHGFWENMQRPTTMRIWFENESLTDALAELYLEVT